MASEEDLAEAGTSLAATTSQVSQAACPGPLENLRCPICLDTINDEASVSWHQHPFCFCCMAEWFHGRVEGPICQPPFPYRFHMVGDSNPEVYSMRESTSAASPTQGGQAGPCSAERWWHHSSGRQHHKSYSRSHGGSRSGRRHSSHGGSRGHSHAGRHGGSHGHSHAGRHGGRHGGSCGHSHAGSRGGSHAGSRGGRRGGSRGHSHAGSHGGSRGRAQEKSQSRHPRRHHDSRSRLQQAQGYNHSRRRRRQQSRAQATAHDRGRAPRTKQRIRPISRRKHRRQEYRVSFIEPRTTMRRSRQRSHSTARQILREYLRKMERDEGRALRQEWYIRASSGRRGHQRRGHRVSYREPQVARSQTPGRFRSRLPLESPRRMEHYEAQPLRTEQGIRASPRRSERHQQGRQVSFIEPQTSRSRSCGRSCSTWHQTLQENLRRMEHDERQALRPNRDIPSYSGWSERHHRGRRISFTEPQAERN